MNSTDELLKNCTASLALVCHEMKNTVNSIIGFSTMIASGTENPKLKQYNKHIIRQNELLLRTLNDLIEVSRLELDSIRIEARCFDFNGLLTDLYDIFSTKCPKKIKLSPVYFPREFYVISDRIRLRQVFINLMSNALKNTEQGEIAFGLSTREKSQIICFVSDTGKGIPIEQQNNIFSLFFKSDPTAQGIGLGLAIVKNIIKLMKGRVWLESSPGKGSVFYFSLPVKYSK